MWKSVFATHVTCGVAGLAVVGCTANPLTIGDSEDADTGMSSSSTMPPGMMSTSDRPMTTSGADGTTSDGSGDDSADASSSSGQPPTPDVPTLGMVDCRDEPPAGAQVAPPLPVYEGECPMLVPGVNEIDSSGLTREFLVIEPEDLDPSERLPVIFLWHWLGGSANDFLEDGDVQAAVNQFRFVAVIPESADDMIFRWPFTIIDPDWRVEQEFRFFDDMLACVGAQYNVEPNCVSSAGVSAGGLFTTQLATGRGQHLASFMSLSGGAGGTFVRPWSESAHVMPAMVLWGGEQDFCVAIDFNNVSLELEQELTDDGHFILECIHNCQHTAPPFEVERGDTAFAPMWSFAFSHPYWLEPGQSPYLEGGVPADMPEWCGIGMGGSDPREGECGPNQC